MEEPTLKKMRSSDNCFEPLLSPEKTRSCVNLQDFYAIQLKSGNILSKLLAFLSKNIPLPAKDVGVLKRIKKLESGFEVLLFPVDNLSLEQASQKFNIKIEAFGEILIDFCLVSVCVPSEPIVNRKQFEFGKLYWPVSFREDKNLEAAILGVKHLFDTSQILQFENYMRKAIEAAKMGQLKGFLAIGCVIVDPKLDKIMAICYDVRKASSPLHHCVMCAIDIIARCQGGGALTLPGKSNLPEGWFQEKNNDGSYLCTGYDLYITDEPCCMCAMALVHSRISRVFYANSNEEYGALGSKLSLHYQRGLNHHYEVYRGLLKNEFNSVTVKII